MQSPTYSGALRDIMALQPLHADEAVQSSLSREQFTHSLLDAGWDGIVALHKFNKILRQDFLRLQHWPRLLDNLFPKSRDVWSIQQNRFPVFGERSCASARSVDGHQLPGEISEELAALFLVPTLRRREQHGNHVLLLCATDHFQKIVQARCLRVGDLKRLQLGSKFDGDTWLEPDQRVKLLAQLRVIAARNMEQLVDEHRVQSHRIHKTTRQDNGVGAAAIRRVGFL